jgi:predicted nuclease with TOPRIM domain
MFGVLTRKELQEYIAKELKQMEEERWLVENNQDKLFAKLKDLERRIEILEGTRPSNMLTPEEVEEQTKKRVEANRYARMQYRKRKAENASNRTPSI